MCHIQRSTQYVTVSGCVVVKCINLFMMSPRDETTSRDLVRRMEELCKKQPLPYRNTLQTLTEHTAKGHED